jgi:hypothetical protein
VFRFDLNLNKLIYNNKKKLKDFTIDKTFKKQSNQISLIEPSLDPNNFSFESLTFTSDTQNLILVDNLKSVYATAIGNGATPPQPKIYSCKKYAVCVLFLSCSFLWKSSITEHYRSI